MKMKYIYTLLIMASPIVSFSQQITKAGGLPASQRWGEVEVNNYLATPIFDELDMSLNKSIDEISMSFNNTSTIGGYEIIGSLNAQEEGGMSFIAFNLEKDDVKFEVRIDVQGSLENIFQVIYNDITQGVELWNNIPESYKVINTESSYVLETCTTLPGKYFLDLENNILISIFSEKIIEGSEEQTNLLESIDNMLTSIRTIINQ